MRLDGAYDDFQKIADTPIVAGGRNLKLSDVATCAAATRTRRPS